MTGRGAYLGKRGHNFTVQAKLKRRVCFLMIGLITRPYFRDVFGRFIQLCIFSSFCMTPFFVNYSFLFCYSFCCDKQNVFRIYSVIVLKNIYLTQT